MLTLSNTPTDLDANNSNVEFVLASKTLANGNVLTIYGVADFTAFGGEGGQTLFGVQTNSSGQPIAGSTFQVFALQPFEGTNTFDPEGIAQFADGSIGIFGEGDLDTGTFTYRQFSIDPTTQTTTFVQEVDFTYDYSGVGGIQSGSFNNAELLTLQENSDGSVTALVGYETLINSSTNGGYFPQVIELDFSSTGVPQDTANSGTVIFDETWNGWVALADGSYVAMDQFTGVPNPGSAYNAGAQVKFVPGTGGTMSSNLMSHLLLPHEPLGTSGFIGDASLVEIAGGARVAAVWTWIDRFADDTEVARTFTAIIEPALQGSDPILTQPVLLQQSVGEDEWEPQIAALPDGTYVVVFSEGNSAAGLPATRAFVQHMDVDGVPLGPRVDIGASATELGFGLSILPNGQIHVSNSTQDGADFDVQAEIYTATSVEQTPRGPVTQLAGGDASQLFDNVVVDGQANSITATQINLVGSDPTKTGIVTGTGFTSDGTGYINDITDGTINSLQLFDNGTLVLQWTGLQIPILALISGIVQDEQGGDYLDKLTGFYIGDYSAASSTGAVIDGGSNFFNTTGSAFGDNLVGGDGNNTIDGGLGADTMVGEKGDDSYVVDNAGDVVTELADEGSDTVFTSISYDVPVNVEVLVMQGSGDLNSNGTDTRDIIIGNDGKNIINGAGGIDVMQGGAGDDVYAVDNSSDAVIEAVGGGFDNVYSSVDYIINSEQEIESAILTGSAVVLRGDDSNNQLFGNDNVNVLEGKGGTDYLLGLGGDDIFQVSLEANATDLDVFGDFEGAGVAGGDRIALDASIWGTDGIVYQVSQTSFIVATAQNTMQQQFIIANLTSQTTTLIAGDDYYFG